MSAEDIPHLILLIGPGFVALQVRTWASEGYRLSDFQRFIWSAFASALLFFVVHGFLRHFPLKVGTLASPEAIVRDPSSAAIPFMMALYVTGAVSGLVVARTLDSERCAELLAWLGFDPARHRDVWRAAFRRSRYVTLFLEGGKTYRGWAEENSSGLEEGDRFVVLSRAKWWSKDQKDWVDTREGTFLLVPSKAIDHMEFHPYTRRSTPGSATPRLASEIVGFLSRLSRKEAMSGSDTKHSP